MAVGKEESKDIHGLLGIVESLFVVFQIQVNAGIFSPGIVNEVKMGTGKLPSIVNWIWI